MLYLTLQDDGYPASLPQSENLEDNVGDDGDESMRSEDEAGSVTAKTASSRQNERLYAEEGILNTKLKKAEKKRRKKDNKSTAMEDDYDFKVDYVSKGSAMEIGEGVGLEDDSSKNRFELPSGVDLENE